MRSASRRATTANGAYAISGCYVDRDGPQGEGTVLVTVEPEGTVLPQRQWLRRRYQLTGREADVARLLARDTTNEAIAHSLGISTHTARHHTERVLAKLGVSSRRKVAEVLRSR